MMKVPRINIGVDVTIKLGTDHFGYGRVRDVDHIRKMFWCHGAPDEAGVDFKDYLPTPTMNNFMRALGEWDYYYNMSDDARLCDEGREYERALIGLFKQLSAGDQHICQKLIAIVQLAAEPAGE